MTAVALVVGAGPAGLAAAVRLAGSCASVTVVDAQARDSRRRVGEHLPPSGLSELATIGLRMLIDDDRHEPSPGVRSCWGEGAVVDKEYFSGLPGYGLNLRREAFDEALALHAERQGATLCFSTRLQRLDPDAHGYCATLQSATETRRLQADILVDATGRHAAAARRLGARRRRFDHAVALIGNLANCRSVPEVGRVHIESVEDGWWYGVPYANGHMLCTLVTDAANLRRGPDAGRALWRARLRTSRLLGLVAANGDLPERIAVCDAATQWLEYPCLPGFLAVGDAAAAYDPLSSWGITKALADGDAGARALVLDRAGDTRALRAHRHKQLRELIDHRARQHAFYSAETRWSASQFWRSHRTGTPTAAAVTGG